MDNWWEHFFDEDYLQLWGAFLTPERTEAEADGLWKLLQLRQGARVLDAPCGYGRLSRSLAERGAAVLGVDQSATLIDRAEQDRGALPAARLRYLRHDLRKPLVESGFDAAFNVFSSLGYGSEEDDLAILRTLRDSVRPGGLVHIDTMHRDVVAAKMSRGDRPASRLADGTIVVEEPLFDPILGRVKTSWYWCGPRGGGHKSASFRVYSATELMQLVERAGFRFRSAHRGCSPDPFECDGADMGGRLGLLCER
jgi:SAM-dependent methyltransferase